MPKRPQQHNLDHEEGPSPPPQPEHTNLPQQNDYKGIFFIAKRNRKHRFFLPSRQNSFGGLIGENVMLDSGCNSLLLPLSGTAAFSELLRLFPSSKEVGECVWSIHTSKGVASQSLTLKISSVSPFQVSLCSNLLCESLQIPFLRFHLCFEDIQHLNDTPELRERLRSSCLQNIRNFLGSTARTPRRTHGLIGQTILQHYLSVQYDQVYFGVKFGDFSKERILKLNELMFALDNDEELPENFDDLEDDDHDGDDEEMTEMSDEDYVD